MLEILMQRLHNWTANRSVQQKSCHSYSKFALECQYLVLLYLFLIFFIFLETALFVSNFLIFLRTVFLSTLLKKRFALCLKWLLIESILEWFLYFVVACHAGWLEKLWWNVSATLYARISRYLSIFVKNPFKEFSASSSFFCSTNIILSLDLILSDKKGLTVCQIFLSWVMYLLLRLVKYISFFFSQNLKKISLIV